MKYIFITGPLNGGGAERVLLDILHNFDYMQHEVHVCQIVAGGQLMKEIPEQVKQLHLWPTYTLGYKLANHISNKLGIDYFIRYRMRQVLTEEYDVAISFLEGTPLKFHAIGQPKAKRHYSWVHCDLYNFPYEKGQFRSENEELKAYNAMDAVICVAKDTEKAFNKRFPTIKTTVRTIYNPVDITKVQRMGNACTIENKNFTVLCLGRISPQKKFDRVVRVAALLKTKGLPIHFQIIGQGELKSEIEQMIKDYGVQDRVEIKPFQSNPFPYVKAAEVLLSSSVAEGFSLVICEAMALGTPVIATRTAGPIEILQDKYGLLCEHDDETIAAAVEQMFLNPDLRRNCAETARARVQDFAVENTMKQIYAL